MKKLIISILIGGVLLLILAVVVVGMFLDKAVKHGVEAVGPMLTKTEVKLQHVDLSLLSGGGRIQGLVIGNPEGYQSPNAIRVGSASLAVQPSSLFSDKVVVKSINVQAPEVTFETDLKGNNLSKIMANLEAATGGSSGETTPPSESAAGKKLQVNEFVVSGGKVNVSLTVMGGKSATVDLPEIRLTDLGTGPEGITAADLSKRLLREILQSAAQAAADAVGDLAKSGAGLSIDTDKAAAGATEKATKALSDLLKKK